MYYVYLLKSKNHDQWYIGYTAGLKRRLKDHNGSTTQSTKRYAPWVLVYYEAYPTERAAKERERKLKHHGKGLFDLKRRIMFS